MVDRPRHDAHPADSRAADPSGAGGRAGADRSRAAAPRPDRERAGRGAAPPAEHHAERDARSAEASWRRSMRKAGGLPADGSGRCRRSAAARQRSPCRLRHRRIAGRTTAGAEGRHGTRSTRSVRGSEASAIPTDMAITSTVSLVRLSARPRAARCCWSGSSLSTNALLFAGIALVLGIGSAFWTGRARHAADDAAQRAVADVDTRRPARPRSLHPRPLRQDRQPAGQHADRRDLGGALRRRRPAPAFELRISARGRADRRDLVQPRRLRRQRTC